MEKKPLLSIGMIFKNEIRCLERCMKSLEPLRKAIPCELVMADTGSEDGSREIAEKYADIFFDFPWINDFAAARNAVLDRCSGEWFLQMDADEWLDPDLSGLTDFFAAGPQENGYAVRMHNLQSAQDRENYSVFWLPRLIRRRGGLLRYQGTIHETPCYEENGEAVSPGPYQRLSALRFYHDGYLEENKKEKSKRNMALLRQKLEREPRNLLCLLQCVQSAGDFEEGLGYSRRMLETARSSRDPREGPLLPAVYQTAIQTAYGASAEAEVYGWLAEAEEKLPKSMLIRIDGNGYAALMAYKREDVARCAEYGAKWRAALAAWDQGEGAEYMEQAFGHLYLVNPYMRLALGCRVLDALCNLEDWENGQPWVEFLSALPISAEFLGRLTGLLVKNSGRLRVSAGLAALWRQCLERYRSEDSELHASGETGLRTMLQELGSLRREDRSAWEAVAGMGDCDPGRSARVLLARNAEEAQAELARVEAWEHVLYPAVGRLTELGVRLPDGFFRLPSEVLAALAAALSEAGWDMTELALRCDGAEDGGDLARLLWAADLAAAAMLRADWAEARGDALCNRFLQLERELGERLYHFEAITEESVSVLPGVHRFGWCLLLGQERLAQGDRAGYVRALRLGVRETPDMKQAAAFLLDRVDRNLDAFLGSPELLALAEQVRTVLAMYPPDDPAVAAVKQSPVYQRVAYLIEGDK